MNQEIERLLQDITTKNDQVALDAAIRLEAAVGPIIAASTPQQDEASKVGSRFFELLLNSKCSPTATCGPASAALSVLLENIARGFHSAPYHLVPQYTDRLKALLKETKEPPLPQLRLTLRLVGCLCSVCDAPSGLTVANLPSLTKMKDLKTRVLTLNNLAAIVGYKRTFSQSEHLAYVKKGITAKEWCIREAALKALIECGQKCDVADTVAKAALSFLTKQLETLALSEHEIPVWARALGQYVLMCGVDAEAADPAGGKGGGKVGWGTWISQKAGGGGDSDRQSPLEQLDSLFKVFAGNKTVLQILSLLTAEVLDAVLRKSGVESGVEGVFEALTAPSQKDDRSSIAPSLANGIIQWAQSLGADVLRSHVVGALCKHVGTKSPKGRCLAALYALSGILPQLYSVAEVADKVLECTSGVLSHPMIPTSVSVAAATAVSVVVVSPTCPAKQQLSALLRTDALSTEAGALTASKVNAALLVGIHHRAVDFHTEPQRAGGSLGASGGGGLIPDGTRQLFQDQVFGADSVVMTDSPSQHLTLRLCRLDLIFSTTALLLSTTTNNQQDDEQDLQSLIDLAVPAVQDKIRLLGTMGQLAPTIQGAAKLYQQSMTSAAWACKIIGQIAGPSAIQAPPARWLEETAGTQFQCRAALYAAGAQRPPSRAEDAWVRLALQELFTCTVGLVAASWPESTPLCAMSTAEEEDEINQRSSRRTFLCSHFGAANQRVEMLDAAINLLAQVCAHGDINTLRQIFVKVFDIYAEVSQGTDSAQRYLIRNISITIHVIVAECLKSSAQPWASQSHVDLAGTLMDQVISFHSAISGGGKSSSGSTNDHKLQRNLSHTLAMLYFLVGAPTVNPQQLLSSSSSLGLSGTCFFAASLVRCQKQISADHPPGSPGLGGGGSQMVELALGSLGILAANFNSGPTGSPTEKKKGSTSPLDLNSPQGTAFLRSAADAAILASSPTLAGGNTSQLCQTLAATVSNLLMTTEVTALEDDYSLCPTQAFLDLAASCSWMSTNSPINCSFALHLGLSATLHRSISFTSCTGRLLSSLMVGLVGAVGSGNSLLASAHRSHFSLLLKEYVLPWCRQVNLGHNLSLTERRRVMSVLSTFNFTEECRGPALHDFAGKLHQAVDAEASSSLRHVLTALFGQLVSDVEPTGLPQFTKLVTSAINAKPPRFDVDEEPAETAGGKRSSRYGDDGGGESGGGQSGQGLARRGRSVVHEVCSESAGKVAAALALSKLMHLPCMSQEDTPLCGPLCQGLFSVCSLVEVLPTAALPALESLRAALSHASSSPLVRHLTESKSQFNTSLRAVISALLEASSNSSGKEHELDALTVVLSLFLASSLADDSSTSKSLNLIHGFLGQPASRSLDPDQVNSLLSVTAQGIVLASHSGWKNTLEAQCPIFLDLKSLSTGYLFDALSTEVSARALLFGCALPAELESGSSVGPPATDPAEASKVDLIRLVALLYVYKGTSTSPLFSTTASSSSSSSHKSEIAQLVKALVCLKILRGSSSTAVLDNATRHFLASPVLGSNSKEALADIFQAVSTASLAGLASTIQLTDGLEAIRSLYLVGSNGSKPLTLADCIAPLKGFYTKMYEMPPSAARDSALTDLFFTLVAAVSAASSSEGGGGEQAKAQVSALALGILSEVTLASFLEHPSLKAPDAAKSIIGFMGSITEDPASKCCGSEKVESALWFVSTLGIPPSTPFSGQTLNDQSITYAHHTFKVLVRELPLSPFVQLIMRSALGRHEILTANALVAFTCCSGAAEGSSSSPEAEQFITNNFCPTEEAKAAWTTALQNFAQAQQAEGAGESESVSYKVLVSVSCIGLCSTFSSKFLTLSTRQCLHTALGSLAANCRAEVRDAIQAQPADRVDRLRGVMSPSFAQQDKDEAQEQAARESSQGSTGGGGGDQGVTATAPAPKKSKLSINISSFQ